MKKLLTFFTIAALISFATGAAATPNTFDANLHLCEGIPIEKIGDPMELWMGVGNEEAGTLVGHVTIVDGDVIIDLIDPYIATDIHIHFAADLDGMPTTGAGNPQVGQFECNVPGCPGYTGDLNGSYYEIPSHIEAGDTVGGIHVTIGVEYSDVDELENVLPDGTVTMEVAWPQPNSYVDLTLTEADVLNGVYDGWCVDDDVPIGNYTPYDAYLYSSYDNDTLATLPFEHPENFPKVNYLLNTFSAGDMVQPLEACGIPVTNCGGVAPEEALTSGDIQRAIWMLIDDEPYSTVGLGHWSQKRVNAILCDVNANGENFIPDCDQDTAFIAVPVDNNDKQMIIAQMILGSIEIECAIEKLGSAWGDAKYGATFPGANSWATYFLYDVCPVE